MLKVNDIRYISIIICKNHAILKLHNNKYLAQLTFWFCAFYADSYRMPEAEYLKAIQRLCIVSRIKKGAHNKLCTLNLFKNNSSLRRSI
jgi:hypothetical protein